LLCMAENSDDLTLNLDDFEFIIIIYVL